MRGQDSYPEGLISREAELERIGTGFGFTEGPCWNRAGGFLVFSDIAGDAIWRWDPSSGFSPYRQPSQMANGSTYDLHGRLVTCEHARSRVVREDHGELEVLADRYQGRELNSPNDVVVGADGSIYFTDPTYGRKEFFGVPRLPELAFQGLYRLRPSGELELLADDFEQPNGLCFSSRADVLFVNDTERMHIRAFQVDGDGSVRGGEVWTKVSGEGPGGPDGMKIDAEGHLYCTGPGGIHVFDADGRHLGMVPTPEVVGNFAWGEDDGRSLFVCASSSLYRLRTVVPGHLPW